MAGLVHLLRYQWRAYWRALRAKSLWSGANMTMVLVLGLLMLPAHIAGCFFAASRMRTDAGGQGALFTELLLLGLFCAWFFLPILAVGIEARGQAISPQRLRQFPLSMRRLFLAGVTGTLVQPIYWMLLFASLLALIPLAAAPRPLLGLPAGLLFLCTSALFSWGVTLLGSAVFASRRGREIAMLLMTAFMLGFILIMNLDLESRDGAFYLEGLGRSWLLADLDGDAGLLVRGRGWLPSAWAVEAALGRGLWLAALAAVAAAAFTVSLLSLRFSLTHPPRMASGRRRLRGLGGLPGLSPAIGAMTRKELSYLARTMDAMLGMALGLGGMIYLLAKDEPSPLVLLFGIPIILLVVTAMPMNCFGLDGRAVDRYRLLPLSGRDVLLSKNLAYFIVSAVQLLPLIVAGGLRFGWGPGLAAPCFAGSILILFVLWGNVVSVRVPAPREFFNFDSKEQAGGVISQLYAMLIWGLPGLVVLLTAPLGDLALFLGQLLLLALCLAVYRNRLGAAGRLFEARAESMRGRLGG